MITLVSKMTNDAISGVASSEDKINMAGEYILFEGRS